jgi:uncharacterized protein (DUF983 family)
MNYLPAIPVRPAVHLPASAWEAIGRGIRFRCPRCGDAHLFARFLKPMAFCPACAQDWRYQRADDFPAYISMLVTGHILAPLIIGLELAFAPPVQVLATVVVALATVMMVGLLQPAKGAVIAVQWWTGMHGFVRERRSEQKLRSDIIG